MEGDLVDEDLDLDDDLYDVHDDIYTMVKCMYLSCHEKVTPSWIIDDDDIYIMKWPNWKSQASAHSQARRKFTAEEIFLKYDHL